MVLYTGVKVEPINVLRVANCEAENALPDPLEGGFEGFIMDLVTSDSIVLGSSNPDVLSEPGQTHQGVKLPTLVYVPSGG